VSDPRAVDPTARDIAEKLAPAYRTMLDAIAQVEPRIAEATRAELTDQRHSLKLIASENYASLPVLATMGAWFSDKYAEGTAGHRFYAGRSWPTISRPQPCQNLAPALSMTSLKLTGTPCVIVSMTSGRSA
jgi:glycine/serine hydroxymethyltransferase